MLFCLRPSHVFDIILTKSRLSDADLKSFPKVRTEIKGELPNRPLEYLRREKLVRTDNAKDGIIFARGETALITEQQTV